MTVALRNPLLKKIGADHFINYEKEDFTKHRGSYDVIFDMVAKSSYTRSLKALKPKGRYITANPRFSTMIRSIITPKISDKQVIFTFAEETEEELLELKNRIEKGDIHSTLDTIFPMEQAGEAHRRVETEQRLGTVVIALSSTTENGGWQ